MFKDLNKSVLQNSKEVNFTMVDVGRKRETRRQAVACGSIRMSEKAFSAIKNATLPKGNALALAEAAGILAAKKTPELLLMCHSIPLDSVEVFCKLDETQPIVTVFAYGTAFAKTGLEMEVLTAVNLALLTIWDLTKGIDPNLCIENTKLLYKSGGKNGTWINPSGLPEWLSNLLPKEKTLENTPVAILVMSDRASKGEYTDRSGPLLKEFLQKAKAQLVHYEVIPDEFEQIASKMLSICKEHKPKLLITSGGTGPGPRDVTPEALHKIADKILDGIGDFIRTESLCFTETSWLSRMSAAMIGSTLVLTFPGSQKAVQECLDIIGPILPVALERILKQGYE